MKILPYKTAGSRHKFTSRAGLMVPAEVIRATKISELTDRLMPRPGSNRGYSHSMLLNTFILMFHEGGSCLEDVRHLRNEPALMGLLGFKRVPSARTLGNWLRGVGENPQSMAALTQITRHLLAVTLKDRKQVTLDIDATVIKSKKKDAMWTYKKHPGYVPMVGHIAETGQVVECEFRAGNVPPNKHNVEFFERCRAALPEGVVVNRFRADAASYQAGIINACRDHSIRFAIRAKMDDTVKESISAIDEDQWQAVVHDDGRVSETEFTARTVHVMADTPQAFCLVVQKRWVGDAKTEDRQPEGPVQLSLDLPGEALYGIDEQSAVQGRYVYRAIATDLDLEGFSDDQIVWWYNQRGDSSENRIKELCSDFHAANLPCGDFAANAVYMKVAAIAYNVLALMRMILPQRWFRCRVITLRNRLYAMAGQVVRHARRWTLKVRDSNLQLLDEVLRSVRRYRLE